MKIKRKKKSSYIKIISIMSVISIVILSNMNSMTTVFAQNTTGNSSNKPTNVTNSSNGNEIAADQPGGFSMFHERMIKEKLEFHRNNGLSEEGLKKIEEKLRKKYKEEIEALDKAIQEFEEAEKEQAHEERVDRISRIRESLREYDKLDLDKVDEVSETIDKLKENNADGESDSLIDNLTDYLDRLIAEIGGDDRYEELLDRLQMLENELEELEAEEDKYWEERLRIAREKNKKEKKDAKPVIEDSKNQVSQHTPQANLYLVKEYLSSNAVIPANQVILEQAIDMVQKNNEQFNDSRGVNNINYNYNYTIPDFSTDIHGYQDTMGRVYSLSNLTKKCKSKSQPVKTPAPAVDTGSKCSKTVPDNTSTVPVSSASSTDTAVTTGNALQEQLLEAAGSNTEFQQVSGCPYSKK